MQTVKLGKNHLGETVYEYKTNGVSWRFASVNPGKFEIAQTRDCRIMFSMPDCSVEFAVMYLGQKVLTVSQ